MAERARGVEGAEGGYLAITRAKPASGTFHPRSGKLAVKGAKSA